MVRAPLLVPAIAIVALLTAAPAAAAPAASLKTKTTASVEFTLRANHGLRAELETFDDEVTLELRRKGLPGKGDDGRDPGLAVPP